MSNLFLVEEPTKVRLTFKGQNAEKRYATLIRFNKMALCFLYCLQIFIEIIMIQKREEVK